MERELAAELAHAMRQISTLPLAESARASLDTELRNARSAAERLQVLRRWFAAVASAHTMTEALVSQHVRAVQARAATPPPRTASHRGCAARDD